MSGYHAGVTLTENLSNSAYDFQRAVWPVVKEWVGAEDLYPSETDSGPFAAVADIFAGIDAWVLDKNGVRGVASRIQYVLGGPTYVSFTIRARLPSGWPTELDKRLQALSKPEEGYLFPMFTVQAYLNEPRTGDPEYICMVKTKDLFDHVARHRDELPVRRNRHDGSEFLVVWCERLLEDGCRLWEMPPGMAELASLSDDETGPEEERHEPYMMLCPYGCGQAVMSDWGWCPDCGEYL